MIHDFIKDILPISFLFFFTQTVFAIYLDILYRLLFFTAPLFPKCYVERVNKGTQLVFCKILLDLLANSLADYASGM